MMAKRFRNILMASAVAVGGLAGGVNAATVGFANISGGDTIGDSLSGYFSLDVTDAGMNTVLITLMSAVNVGMTYFIGSVYIDDADNVLSGEATALSPLNSIGNVAFAHDRKTKNFPQGNMIGFDGTDSYSAANGSGNAQAVQPGETLGFVFGGSLVDVLAAFDEGTLRFGLHVQGIGQGSDSFVSDIPTPPAPVPLPAAGFLLLGAVGGLSFLRSRKAA